MGTRSGRGPIGRGEATTSSAREVAVRAYLHRWAEAAGARLLMVDRRDADDSFTETMAGRGVHVTWAPTTVDGLIEFGRVDPHAVVIAPDAPGLPAADFVDAVRRHGASYVVAALRPGSDGDAAEVGDLMLAGASAVVTRPYTAEHLWHLLSRAPRPLDDHAHLAFGPVELDAGAYQVSVHGVRIADLPLKEFELLRALMLKAPEVVTDDELRAALWSNGNGRARGNTIAMHVTRLRARLGDAVTVRRIRGRGYSLAL